MKQVPFGPVRFDILQLKRKDRATLNSIEELQEELDNTLTSVSGNPITISDASNTNAEDFIVTIVPTQAGTGDPSPDNIRPITGLSSVDVVLNDNAITCSLGSTIYGGNINFSTGVLTVDRTIMDLGDMNWTYDSTNIRFVTSAVKTTIEKPSSNSVAVDAISSAYRVLPFTSFTIDNSLTVTTDGDMTARNTDYTDADTFKAAMSGVKFVYKLATPTTTTLTAQQIRLLQGENELSTTGSSMSFKYQRDNLIGELKAWVLDQLS